VNQYHFHYMLQIYVMWQSLFHSRRSQSMWQLILAVCRWLRSGSCSWWWRHRYDVLVFWWQQHLHIITTAYWPLTLHYTHLCTIDQELLDAAAHAPCRCFVSTHLSLVVLGTGTGAWSILKYNFWVLVLVLVLACQVLVLGPLVLVLVRKYLLPRQNFLL